MMVVVMMMMIPTMTMTMTMTTPRRWGRGAVRQGDLREVRRGLGWDGGRGRRRGRRLELGDYGRARRRRPAGGDRPRVA